MRNVKVSRNTERGGISITQVVVGAIVAAVLYAAVMYVPGVMNKSTMNGIARDAAARMVLESNDAAIREEIVKKATAAGIVIGQSEIKLERRIQPTVKYTVTLTWTEKVKHVWGSTQVSKSTASGIAEPGKSGIKNAQ